MMIDLNLTRAHTPERHEQQVGFSGGMQAPRKVWSKWLRYRLRGEHLLGWLRRTGAHRRSHLKITWLLMLAFLIGACGQPAPQPLTWAETPWQAGEQSLFQITDVNGRYAGTARYRMTALDNGWLIEREIVAQGSTEVVNVSMNAGLRPLRSQLIRSTGFQQGNEMVTAIYNSGQVDMELTTAQNVTTYERASIPSDASDSNVLIMLARALPLEVNYATRINAYLPVVGLLETYTVVVRSREEVSVPAGLFSTFKVELRTRDYTTTAWITDDSSRVLVKYLDGRNQGSFELSEYQTGE